MSKIKTFIEDRNEAFASGDIDKIKAYCRKYKIEIPEDEEGEEGEENVQKT